MNQEYRNILSGTRCASSLDKLARGSSVAIEELYQNIQNIENSLFRPLQVQNNAGTVIIPQVFDLVTNEMTLEDLGGNAARITPSLQNVPVITPGGGIAGSTSTTLSSATCTKLHTPSSTIERQTTDIDVYNLNSSAVSGNAIVLAHYSIDDQKWYTMGCCSNTSITIPGTETAPSGPQPPDPDGGGGEEDHACDKCNSNTLYHQYDITFRNIAAGSLPGSLTYRPCGNCIDLLNDQTFRVTRIVSEEWGCGDNTFHCDWAYDLVVHNGAPFVPGLPGLQDNPYCGSVRMRMRLFELPSVTVCSHYFDPADTLALIVQVQLNNGTVLFDFSTSFPSSPVDCGFSSERCDINTGFRQNTGGEDCVAVANTYCEVSAVTS